MHLIIRSRSGIQPTGSSLPKSYILQMKFTFIQLDKGVKRVKGTRTTFDITSSTTALTGSVLASSASKSSQKSVK